jgi:hypothetical protein
MRWVVIATYGFEMSSPSMSTRIGRLSRAATSGNAISSADVN